MERKRESKKPSIEKCLYESIVSCGCCHISVSKEKYRVCLQTFLFIGSKEKTETKEKH